jgi:predicted acylesterase/phospholipase RssA
MGPNRLQRGLRPLEGCAPILVGLGFFCLTALSFGQDAFPKRRPKIVLALSGGAAYSLTEFGALEWFEQHRIPVDALVGTSGGAIVGGWYSTGIELLTDQEIATGAPHRSDEDMRLHGVADVLSKIDLNAIFRPYPGYDVVDVDGKTLQRQFPFGAIGGIRNGRYTFTDGLVPGANLENLLDTIGSDFPPHQLGLEDSAAPFDSLPTPFRAVASQPHGYDVHDWERIVLGARDGLPKLLGYPLSLQDAIRSSVAIPYIFTPRYLPPVGSGMANPAYGLVDGGLTDNYPTDIACDVFHPDVLIGLKIDVDLNPLRDFYRLTGHKSPSAIDVEKISNEFKFGKSATHRPESFSIQMHVDGARPDKFDQWRRLSFLGYQSMEAYAKTPKGMKLLSYSLSPAAYSEYRAARRSVREKFKSARPRGVDRAAGDELTSRLGLGSVSVSEFGTSEGVIERPRYIGPLQFFGDLGGSTSTGDRSYLDARVHVESFGLGGRYNSLQGDLDLGTFSQLKLGYNVTPAPESWFLKPYVQVDSAPRSEFSDGSRAVTEQTGEQKLGVEVGTLPITDLKLSLASELGNASLQQNRHFFQEIARLRYDSRNSELYSTHGLLIDGFVRAIGFGDSASMLYQASVDSEYRLALNRRYTITLKASSGTSFGARPTYDLNYSLGGPGSLQGYPADFLTTPGYSEESFELANRLAKIPFYIGDVRWVAGVEFAQGSEESLSDVYSGLLISTRATKLYGGVSVSDHFRPRLILGFGNRPFSQTALFGTSE